LLVAGEPIAFAVHLQDVDMMGEPVEQGAGEPFGAEYGSPFIERQIAGDRSVMFRLAKHERRALSTP
jgi:hypothetical protein